ncbi:ribonuclease HIII [Mycoplasma sp. Ms02]|uniref:ribonuclease HIII n=1 Tax=Mycoplasma sp. Ms02 TaxID=353851 RepID=UPI001C8968FC|nr:ribonuclease HIII [Mycoplasma sp. Ms02]QZE12273.1 ribonuclease HIII [Mycoplasma sp. Ms02]
MILKELKKLDDLQNKAVMGVDETGVGDFFGPLVSCAAVVYPNQIKSLIALGVQDSKKYSDKQISQIAKKIKDLVYYQIYHLTPKGYNSLKNGKNQYNANELKFFSHAQAIALLNRKLNENYDLIFIDQYSTFNSINKYYNKILVNNNWAQIDDVNKIAFFATKAESKHVAVACASIFARDYFIHARSEMVKKYNFDFPLGASIETQKKVIEFEETYGTEMLNEVCKTSFKITKL